MTFHLSSKSYTRLYGVHDDMREVVDMAIKTTTVDFAVLEGVRSVERQKELFQAGATQTMNSRHLSGKAVDLVALVNGKVSWHPPLYQKIADAMKNASVKLNVPIVWGGDWRTFKDLVHFELDRSKYP